MPLNTYQKGEFLPYQLADADLATVVVDAAGFTAITPVLPATSIKQVIVLDDVDDAGASVPVSAYRHVAGCLTESQKERFLPGILSGDLQVSIGYTEPETGTDLAALKDPGRP